MPDEELMTGPETNGPEIEVEHSADTLDYLSARAEEISEEFNSDEADGESTEEVEAEEVSAEGVEEVSEEEEDQPADVGEQVEALSRIMAKESKQRADREAFDSERAAFEKEKEDHAATLADYRQAKAQLARNPLGFLKALGASEDDLQTIGQMIVYDSLGEDAPSDYKDIQEKYTTRQQLAELQAKLDKQEQERNLAEQNKSAAKMREEYVETLFDAVDEIPDDFPYSQKFTELEGAEKVVQTLYQYAEQNARQNDGAGNALTPEECLQRLEKQLAKFARLNNVAQDKPAPTKKVKKRKTLRTKTTKLQKPVVDYDKMTPEEVVAAARKDFLEYMNGE